MSAQTAPATAIILTEDFFGVVANRLFAAIQEGGKPQRKDAFLTIKQMAKTAGLLTSKEKILSIGMGVNTSGQRHINIVLESPQPSSILPNNEPFEAAVRVCNVASELISAMDAEEADIGGYRSPSAIVKDLGHALNCYEATRIMRVGQQG